MSLCFLSSFALAGISPSRSIIHHGQMMKRADSRQESVYRASRPASSGVRVHTRSRSRGIAERAAVDRSPAKRKIQRGRRTELDIDTLLRRSASLLNSQVLQKARRVRMPPETSRVESDAFCHRTLILGQKHSFAFHSTSPVIEAFVNERRIVLPVWQCSISIDELHFSSSRPAEQKEGAQSNEIVLLLTITPADAPRTVAIRSRHVR